MKIRNAFARMSRLIKSIMGSSSAHRTPQTIQNAQIHRASMMETHDGVLIDIGECTDESSIGSICWFRGGEYYKLLSDMQMLREMIENTTVLDHDTNGHDEQDANFISRASFVEEHLLAIRVNIDRRQRLAARGSGQTAYEDVDFSVPLERDLTGHTIHEPIVIDCARMDRLERSPEFRTARRMHAYQFGYLDGLFHDCILWIVAGLVAPYFGECATYAKWAMIVLGLAYLIQPRYVDP